MPVYRGHIDSPIGKIQIEATEKGIRKLYFVPDNEVQSLGDSAAISLCKVQLNQYFKGMRSQFDVPLDSQGTPFQYEVWECLRNIPISETLSYKSVAETIGNPRAVRAVGNACKCNPIMIIVPCHRVVGSSGALTGYAGGTWRKQWLLDFEAKPL